MSELLEDLIECNEKIDLLEAELADTRHVLGLTELARRQLGAELADLRASSVVYKVRCETCGGHGFLDCPTDCMANDHFHPCPDCVNGWQLAEGVVKFEGIIGFQNQGPHYSIPARLIEGDTDG